MKKILKVIGIILLLSILGLVVMYVIYNEPLPEGKEGPEANALAKRMLKQINHEAYSNTRYIEWSFTKANHHYKWDKENGKVQVKWKSNTVNLNLNNPQKSTVLIDNIKVLGSEKEKLTQTALDYFNNDSFWVVAPFKVFDDGVSRKLVDLDNNQKGLLVNYASGGSTPGDSYLWKFQDSGFPDSYQMWVKIIPIGGLEASWDDWKIMESGAFLPASHKLGPIDIGIDNLRAYNE